MSKKKTLCVASLIIGILITSVCIAACGVKSYDMEALQFQIKQVCQYDIEGDERLFIMFQYDPYNGQGLAGQHWSFEITEDNDVEVVFEQEAHFNAEQGVDMNNPVNRYVLRAAVVDIPEGASPDIIFNNEIVRSYIASQNVPAWVLAFDEDWQERHEEGQDSDGVQNTQWYINYETRQFGCVYPDGTHAFWDLSGREVSVSDISSFKQVHPL